MSTSTRADSSPKPPTPFTRFARQFANNWLLYVLLLPSLLFSVIFFYYPITSGFYHSFTYWDIKQTVWVGLENYIRLFDDSSTPAAWRNMAIILISNMIIVCIFPLFGAVLVVRLRNAVLQYWWRILFVLPIIVPATVTVYVWRWFYGLDGGLNQILRMINLGALGKIWLGEPSYALGAIIFVGFPWVAGLNFLIYVAALQSISQEILDSAKVDGADSFTTFFFIELPLIRNQILVLITLTFIYYLRSFDAPLIMTNGGPGTAGTLVPGLQMYRAVRDDLDLGYGSAIGMVLFAATLIFTAINFFISRRQAKEESSQ